MKEEGAVQDRASMTYLRFLVLVRNGKSFLHGRNFSQKYLQRRCAKWGLFHVIQHVTHRFPVNLSWSAVIVDHRQIAGPVHSNGRPTSYKS